MIVKYHIKSNEKLMSRWFYHISIGFTSVVINNSFPLCQAKKFVSLQPKFNRVVNPIPEIL